MTSVDIVLFCYDDDLQVKKRNVNGRQLPRRMGSPRAFIR